MEPREQVARLQPHTAVPGYPAHPAGKRGRTSSPTARHPACASPSQRIGRHCRGHLPLIFDRAASEKMPHLLGKENPARWRRILWRLGSKVRGHGRLHVQVAYVASARWHEWEQTSEVGQQLAWSRGVRELVGPATQQNNKANAKDNPGADDRLILVGDTWCDAPVQVDLSVEAAATDGIVGANPWPDNAGSTYQTDHAAWDKDLRPDLIRTDRRPRPARFAQRGEQSTTSTVLGPPALLPSPTAIEEVPRYVP